MSDARLHVYGSDLQVNGKFQYVRQVGDVGDISTSNANHTNSFAVIRDNNSTRALKGLGLAGSLSKLPYIKFPGILIVDEIPIIDHNGWAVINETDESNYKISIIDGNIDFWKAIEGLTLNDIDLSEANYAKTRQGIIDSFTSPYQKYLLGYYALGESEKEAFDITLLNPAISDKYILDQIFNHIGMTYQMTPVIDTWTVVGQTAANPIADVTALYLEATNGVRVHQYNRDTNSFDFTFSNIETEDLTFDPLTKKIEVTRPGTYRMEFDWTTLEARYFLLERGGEIFFDELPIQHFLEVNGTRYELNQDVILYPDDEIYLRFIPLTAQQVQQYYPLAEIHAIGAATSWDYEFELLRMDTIYYSFHQELGKITVKEFIKQIMHRYAFTLFYKDKVATFLTIDERLNAEVVDITDYFVSIKSEKYLYRNYAQRNYLRMKYHDQFDNWNDGVIYANNVNLDLDNVLLESFTFSQNEVTGEMPMWTYKGMNEPYEQIKGRYFSVRANVVWDTVQFRDRQTPLPSYVGDVAFVDFEKTGFRYYKNKYYKGFEERILKDSKLHVALFDMPLLNFLNLDLMKVYHVQGERYLINKITYKGLKEVEAELIRIN